jgi:diaminohydroxyphosphoribosylaminopyrimidine deaminase/5-amino-6-(5-phosphoribosylamino)uracil reductase
MPVTEMSLATEQDRLHLRRALELAERGRGRVSPNPLVGAVLVRDGEPIGEGFHAEYGGLHAETAALADCYARGADPAGATMYVTLEPCAHTGQQPPCTDAIVRAGIARVVIASEDPTEKASGRGPGILRDEGVDVVFAEGAEAAAARLLNQAFRKHARTGRPLVVFKLAMSLDGRVATAQGDSRWISGKASRTLVHGWRAEYDAVAVGIGTVLADDPLLTAREVEAARQPARVAFDSAARLPPDSQLARTVGDARLLVVTAPEADAERVRALQATGAEIVVAAGDSPADRVGAALTELGRRGIHSLMLEGGPKLAGAFLDAGEVDELRVFVAPIVVGGSEARAVAEGGGVARIADAARALAVDVERIGDDVLIVARMREW